MAVCLVTSKDQRTRHCKSVVGQCMCVCMCMCMCVYALVPVRLCFCVSVLVCLFVFVFLPLFGEFGFIFLVSSSLWFLLLFKYKNRQPAPSNETNVSQPPAPSLPPARAPALT